MSSAAKVAARGARLALHGDEWWGRFTLEFLLGAALTVALLGACAVHGDGPNPNAAPRAMSVPESATPEQRGQEVLRVTVILVKYGDLGDTDFVSRLLDIPRRTDGRTDLFDSQRVPQQLMRSVQYSLAPPPHVYSATLHFSFDAQRTCVSRDDLLVTFKRELGVGTDLVPDSVAGQVVDVPIERGWQRATLVRDAHPASQRFYRYFPNGVFVAVDALMHEACVLELELSQRQRN